MEFSVGLEVLKVDRFEEEFLFDEKKLKGVFSEVELELCSKKRINLACRLAAKRAFCKVIGKSVDLRRVEIINENSGKPKIYFEGGFGGVVLAVSLSQTKKYAAGLVLLQKSVLPSDV